MKDRNEKKKFKESKIGKIIYGFLLFMPLFAIGVTCGYAMFNKNAYQSYSNFNVEETKYTKVTDYSLIVGNEYKFISNNLDNANLKTATNGQMNIENFNLISSSRDLSSYNLDLINGYYLYRYNNNTVLHLLSSQNIPEISFASYNITFTFKFLSYTGVNQSNNFDYYFDGLVYHKDLVQTSNTIDNVFYYSVDKVTQSNLFNWVTTSNIYTGMSNFTTAMSVTNTFIPMLLTYWLIISVIYFLYDMVLILLTVLHRKIHNLQDSI